jgi:hypothetical protein
MAQHHFMALLVTPEHKVAPRVKARLRTAKMDAFMSKINASPRYEVETVAASMSEALAAARAKTQVA